jgi:hypothetical protein
MDFVTYQQAIDITGKNKRTIQRSVSSGKLSYITKVIDGKEVKLFNRAELVALHGQMSPMSPMTVPLTNQPQVDYQTIAEIISKAIVEAQQPLLEQVSDLTEKVNDLTNRLGKPKYTLDELLDKCEPAKGERIDTPSFMTEEPKAVNYLDDIPTFGKMK